MNHSLQRHLSLTLGGTLLLAGLVAAAASFILAYYEAKEFQDDMLRQIAVLDNGGMSASARASESDEVISDPESLVVVIHLPGNPRPAWLPEKLRHGFQTLSTPEGQWRVFNHVTATGRQVVVAQPTEGRDEIAINSALRTLIPLLMLLPLLLWLIVRIVRTSFSPISKFSATLDKQAADRPDLLPETGLPDEIIPFVQAINRLLVRVTQLMAKQRRFIADAAHELRSPLAALSIQAQNLYQADTLKAVQERIAPLQSGIERARQLTEQLLDLAKIQMGDSASEMVDVSAMARELLAENLSRAEAKGIDLGLSESARLSFRTARNSLRLILNNALDNSLKYTPAGGSVTIRLANENNMAVIEVIDTGTGIPESERESVFNAFYRIPGSAGIGSGLGLSIAQEAASRTGGVVSLHDRPDGSGLVFRYVQPSTMGN